MINIIYEESTRLTEETKATIQDLADFALNWYSNQFAMPVTDLDTMRFFLYPVEGHAGVFGIANDGANVDRVSVREDLYVDGDFTSPGYNTLCHELIHFCQYATDFERKYNVPYAQRPQEVQAFQFSQELLTAWRLSKIPVIDMPVVVEDEDIEDEPIMDTPSSEPTNSSRRNIWILLGIGLLVAVLLSGCSKRFLDFVPATAGTVGAAVCHPAGPGASAFCAGAAAAGVEVAIPPESRALSDDPEVAKQQLKTEERELWIMVLREWGLWIIVIGGLILWGFPSPQELLRKMKNGR